MFNNIYKWYVKKPGMITLFLYSQSFYHSWFEHLLTKYWDWVNPIHLLSLLILMLLILDFIFKERYVKILKDKKLIIIRIFGENFGLFQKSLTNKRKKNWVELSHSAIANWETTKETEENKKTTTQFLHFYLDFTFFVLWD